MTTFGNHRLRAIVAAAFLTATAASVNGNVDDERHSEFLDGRIIAIGIPGISAISQVGTFLPGGPIHDNPAFAAYTQPGRVLDPSRILSSAAPRTSASLWTIPLSFRVRSCQSILAVPSCSSFLRISLPAADKHRLLAAASRCTVRRIPHS